MFKRVNVRIRFHSNLCRHSDKNNTKEISPLYLTYIITIMHNMFVKFTLDKKSYLNYPLITELDR